MGGWIHLARRFFGSLRPGGPAAEDVAWVDSLLAPRERALWRGMDAPDRRHSVRVARAVARRLGAGATAPVLAAALLHDVGKTEARLTTPGRVAATLVIRWAGRARAAGWRDTRGLRGRIARYSLHPQLGAELLRAAGSDPIVVAWAREHHEPREAWTVPAEIAGTLRGCDDD